MLACIDSLGYVGLALSVHRSRNGDWVRETGILEIVIRSLTSRIPNTFGRYFDDIIQIVIQNDAFAYLNFGGDYTHAFCSV